MLQKWKNILTNWINCYFSESDDKEPCVTLDSLLSIISHLRENLSLDESKSAILEARTVEEFIQEKYPEFTFPNGTVEANEDDELYMVASLLLYFVCVNSKDIDIKNAMCSRLSSEDQKVILKFSKCLMECTPIMYKDVKSAITDACSTDTMAAESSSTVHSVSETPPALRSLHGEVRRLQAALDAERFDRNYLQEELARTNLRVEKLAKDKEQYKLDIVNLKAKISLCCGQESETKTGDKASEGTAKLMKELLLTEERLVQTQGQLDEALYERDAYKEKVNELKKDRDKWLSLSQQEGARVSQLSEELSVERRHVQSLKELVEELRQHQQLNRLDTSQLECDDPDASIQSLTHNSSICSEACVNVVEVQLSEERAKIILLKQQIQSLQEQLNDLAQKSETEIVTLNKIVSEKDNDIFNLKHRINEEIEAKNKLVLQYSDTNSRLNNEINELEQKLKDNSNQYRLVLESKMQEIQTLQEEKLSLLQSLNDETTKLEGIIKNLKSEIAAEKDSKQKMKEDFDSHVMKLNEKVLNRNNELVELQNNVCVQSEQIESLHLELRKEKQARDEVLDRYYNELQLVNSKNIEAENMIQQKNEEIESLMDKLNNNYTYTEELNREMHMLKDSISQLTAICNNMGETNDSLNKEITIRDDKLDEQCKEIENYKNVLSEERDNHKKRIDEYEIKITSLTQTIEETRDEITRQKDSYTAVLESRARDIHTLQQENQSLVDELDDVKQQLDVKVHSLEEKLTESENLTEKLKNSYECQIENLNVMVTKLTSCLKDKTVELDSLKKEKERLQEIINDNHGAIKALEEEVKSQKDNREKMISEFESERSVLKNMVTLTESVMEDQKTSLNEMISNHVQEIKTLKGELKDIQHRFATEKAATEVKIQENEEIFEGVIKELSEERNAKEKLEKEVDNQKQYLTSEINKLKEQLVITESDKQTLESQNKELTGVLQKCSEEFALIKKEKNELVSEIIIFKENMESLTCKLSNLESRCKDLEHDSQRSRKVIAQMKEHNKNLESEINNFKKDIDLKQKQLEDLRMENNELEGLLQICQNDKELAEESKKELKIEKDLQETELSNKAENISKKMHEQVIIIQNLESELDDKTKRNIEFEENLLKLTNQLETLTNNNEQLKLESDNDKSKIEELITEMSTNIVELNNEIAKLNAENFKLLKSIDNNQVVITSLEDEVKSEKQHFDKIVSELKSEKQVLIHKIAVSKSVIEKQKENQNHILSKHAEVCAALKKENMTLKENINAEKEKFEKVIQEKNTKITTMTKQFTDAKMKSENVQKHFQAERNNLVAEIEKLKSEIDLKSSQIGVLETQKQENMTLKDRINTEKEYFEKVLQEKNTEITAMTKETTDAKIESENVQKDLLAERNNLVAEIETLKSEIDSKSSQIEILELQKQELSAALRKENTTLKEKINAEKELFEKVIQEKDTKITAMAKETTEAKVVGENVQKHFQAENNNLVAEIETLKTEINSKSSKIEILESQNQELSAALRKENITFKEKINAEREIFEKIIQEKETKITAMTKEITDAILESENVQKHFQAERNNLVAEIETLKSEIDSKSSQIKILESQRQDLSGALKKENMTFKEKINAEKEFFEKVIQEKDTKITAMTKEMTDAKIESENIQIYFQMERNNLVAEIKTLKTEMNSKSSQIEILESQKQELSVALQQCKEDIALIEEHNKQIKIKKDVHETELLNKVDRISKELDERQETNRKLVLESEEKDFLNADIEARLSKLSDELEAVLKDKVQLEQKLSEYEAKSDEVKLEIEKLKHENTQLANIVENKKMVISSLENEVQTLKQAQEKYVADFNLEKQNLNEMISVSESLVEEHKANLNQVTLEHLKFTDALKEEIKTLKETINTEKKNAQQKLQEKEIVLETKIRKLYELMNEKENHQKILIIEKESLAEEIITLKKDITLKSTQIETFQYENKRLEEVLLQCKNDLASMEVHNNELKILIDSQETEFNKKVENISKQYNEQVIINKHLESTVEEKHKLSIQIEEKVRALNNQVEVLTKAYNRLEQEKNEYRATFEEMKAQISKKDETLTEEFSKLREDKVKLTNLVDDDKKVILNLEEAIKREKESNDSEKLNLNNKCSILQEYQIKAETLLEERQKELTLLEEEIKTLKSKTDNYEKVLKEKDEIISSVKQELAEVNATREKLQTEVNAREAMVVELQKKMDNAHSEDVARACRNEEWVKAIGQRDIYAVASSERTGSHKHSGPLEKEYRDYHHQVDNTTSDLAHSSMESIKTISDLERIIHDRNRTITTLQSDITYLKTLVADSENKLLDVSKELEVTKENCQQLSSQLKKIVHQKNEEIAELKKQVNKMSITENRASQIIKVSAKYQAIILKRISEIKSNAVLKELTNFGNSANGDNELRRSLNAGTITMEDLENFLETTDKHLRRCSEKQIALQKERDRLTEVNRINESEIINLKKFLTELSVGFKTFGSVKELYTQKLSRVVSVQRTVRREILSLDGHINDATMCKLERGYAAVMQDLSECVMNLERWVERCISRTISPEKIKQAFSTDDDRASLASASFQNASLEVQLEELENSFQKLLEEVVRAQKGEGARDAQSVTVMEVRAEYEDKLNRMKAKMKQLYQEQITVFKENQRDEISAMERELCKTRDKLAESSKAYEEHIRALTTELWRVGEKFLTKKDELEWERKKQRSGSLMSLQHIHSSGLVPPPRDESLRTSDAHSLRSLPVHNNTNKREGRGLHMSDEEGEVFDNRCLKEIAATPGKRSSPGRISELRWRNSLCPPHLKSSYPAETQFAPAIDEEEIKCTGAASIGGRNQRKEVGITAYKKPGPPTPSKQAGRVSATDSELRESLRSEPEPHASRKTSTPSRLRALFRSNKNDTAEGTPRSRRLSFFKKK